MYLRRALCEPCCRISTSLNENNKRNHGSSPKLTKILELVEKDDVACLTRAPCKLPFSKGEGVLVNLGENHDSPRYKRLINNDVNDVNTVKGCRM